MAKQYGRWRVCDGSLGEGGQSHVFTVEDSKAEHHGQFALKRLKNPKRVARFKAELHAIQRISHPNVVKVLDADLTSDPAYYVTTLYKRGDAETARVHAWPLPDKIKFFTGVLAGVEAAHNAGVIHRDIKPENILVADDNTPVVADFGICFFEQGSRQTLVDEAMGARHYTHPDLEGGRVKEVEAKHDFYSVGKLLYWLFAGQDLAREFHRQERFNLVQTIHDTRLEIVNEFLDRLLDTDPRLGPLGIAGLQLQWGEVVRTLQEGVNYPRPGLWQRCIYCGTGHYEPLAERQGGHSSSTTLYNTLGLQQVSGCELRAHVCTHCGNVQLFTLNQPGNTAKYCWDKPVARSS